MFPDYAVGLATPFYGPTPDGSPSVNVAIIEPGYLRKIFVCNGCKIDFTTEEDLHTHVRWCEKVENKPNLVELVQFPKSDSYLPTSDSNLTGNTNLDTSSKHCESNLVLISNRCRNESMKTRLHRNHLYFFLYRSTSTDRYHIDLRFIRRIVS